MVDRNGDAVQRWPTVTIVIVVYNRRDELRETLRRMLFESDYDRDRVDVIVVDNASRDGSAAIVREEFPQVHLIERETNIGAPAWNDGFAVAGGDYVLILDDDCYLPPDGLRRAVAPAEEHEADLVSFKVISTHDPSWVFSDRYRTGLFSFWGCAWLIRRSALEELGGYDPEIFMWANELELTIRLYDQGYRHLHFPDVVAQHMKAPGPLALDVTVYRVNARHWAYVAARLLRPRDAVGALIALLARSIRHGLREDPGALTALPITVKGFVHGLRYRRPVGNRELSRLYRRNFETFVSPWRLARPARELLRALPRETVRRILFRELPPKAPGHYEKFFAERPDVYPNEPAFLDFRPDSDPAAAGGVVRLTRLRKPGSEGP
jgi:GT2 family glycosyltransferase